MSTISRSRETSEVFLFVNNILQFISSIQGYNLISQWSIILLEDKTVLWTFCSSRDNSKLQPLPQESKILWSWSRVYLGTRETGQTFPSFCVTLCYHYFEGRNMSLDHIFWLHDRSLKSYMEGTLTYFSVCDYSVST